MILDAQKAQQLLKLHPQHGKPAQVGYDLTLKSIKSIKGGSVFKDKTVVREYHEIIPSIGGKNRFIYNLIPGTYSLTFHQGCKLDTTHSAFIRHRSSVLRCGGIITSGVYDSGFEVDEMGAVLIATQDIMIEQDARVAQIVIFENYQAEAYDGQWNRDGDYK